MSKGHYQRYFKLQIDTLMAEKYGVLRHTSEGDEVKQERLDSMSEARWNQELRGFVNAQYVDLEDTADFYYSMDQSGKFEIRRFMAKDTLAPLQRWEEMKVDGVTQLITWETQKRSVLMDRRVEMTYQPLKGYRVRMQEDAVFPLCSSVLRAAAPLRPIKHRLASDFMQILHSCRLADQCAQQPQT